MPASRPVYLVDDDPLSRESIVRLLADHGVGCRAFADSGAFLAALDGLEPGSILLEMGGRINGLHLQAKLLHRGCTMPVIALSRAARINVAVDAMKIGAIDFLEKPVTVEQLLEALGEGARLLKQAKA